MKPNKRAIRAWVKALRSGRYKQTQGTLRQIPDPANKHGIITYCCLGVACDLYLRTKAGKESGWEGSHFDNHAADLPEHVAEWLGFCEDEYVVQDPEVKGCTLSQWNDSGASFKKIATLIEKEWLK